MKNKKDYMLCGQHRNASDDKCTDLKRHGLFDSDLKHRISTPTPWKAELSTVSTVYQEGEEENIVCSTINRADAAFIVKAVNCHDDLVSCLKNLVERGLIRGIENDHYDEVLSLLEKAEGK